MRAIPFTTEPNPIFWGLANSSLGSTSVVSFRAPTLKVLSSLRPVAVRTRRSTSPRAAFASIFTSALTWFSSTFSIFEAEIPG